jgi:hypothetical protein
MTEVWRTKVRFHFMGQRATEDLYTTQSVAVDRKLRQKVYYDFVAIHTRRELQHMTQDQ